MLKMYLIFEVLRLSGTVFGTASVVQTINKYSLYGHLLPLMEKHLMESFQVTGPLLLKPLVYQIVSERISDHMVICE